MRTGPRLSITPAVAVSDKRLSHAAFRLLATLGTYTDNQGWCFPSYDELSRKSGLSRRSVITAMHQLIELGYVVVTHRSTTAGASISNLYRVRYDLSDPEVAAALTSKQEVDDGGAIPAPQGADVALRGAIPSISRGAAIAPQGADSATPGGDRGCTPEGAETARGGATCLHPIRNDPESSVVERERTRVREVDPIDRLLQVAGPGLADPSKEGGENLRILTRNWVDRALREGADLELDAVPVVEALTAQPRARPLNTWKYFYEPIRRHAAERMAELVPITPAEGGARGTGRAQRQPVDLQAVFDAADAYSAKFRPGGR